MLAGLFLSLYGIGKQIRNAFWFGFIRFCFRENERREVYGVGIFAKNDGDDVRRQTSSCGGMVANERKGCIQSDSTNADEITPKPPQKNEQNIR